MIELILWGIGAILAYALMVLVVSNFKRRRNAKKNKEENGYLISFL